MLSSGLLTRGARGALLQGCFSASAPMVNAPPRAFIECAGVAAACSKSRLGRRMYAEAFPDVCVLYTVSPANT